MDDMLSELREDYDLYLDGLADWVENNVSNDTPTEDSGERKKKTMDRREERIVCERFIKICAESLSPEKFSYLEDIIIPDIQRARFVLLKKVNEMPIDGNGHISEEDFINPFEIFSHNQLDSKDNCCGIFNWIKDGVVCCNECGISLVILVETIIKNYEDIKAAAHRVYITNHEGKRPDWEELGAALSYPAIK